ncbi:MAG: TM2 domain-containing membrane protein YozV [Flavobacteriales bacterium]
MYRLLLTLLVLFSLSALRANQPVSLTLIELHSYAQQDAQLDKVLLISIQDTLGQRRENPRWVAAMLTVGLGLFGVHRMYLGTDMKVPIIYVLTLGGGLGVLPMIDLLTILFTKDLEQFMNNDKVFMWAK